MKMPACMMPDGGDACQGYDEQFKALIKALDENDRLKEENEAFRAQLDHVTIISKIEASADPDRVYQDLSGHIRTIDGLRIRLFSIFTLMDEVGATIHPIVSDDFYAVADLLEIEHKHIPTEMRAVFKTEHGK